MIDHGNSKKMFEVIARDAAGRLGRLKTSHGTVLTPTLMPVYNPNIPLIPANELEHDFKVQMLITNAYIIYRTPELREKASQGVHKLINFHRAIMTDSGAYQAWMYKKELDITNREIIQFEEILEPDVATILDTFTETDDYDIASKGVESTIEAAKECINIRQNEKIFWAAPVQGGKFLDLLELCASKLSALEFDIHPLGTLAPSLQKYNYKQVVETILVTKQNINPSRPFHGFSIGHPMFFALAVACGTDLFDSSAYALFAKDNRYLTYSGTLRFENLEEFPCVCPVCNTLTPQDLREMDDHQRKYLLAKHNLYATIDEIKRIRVAIRENRLWELVQERVRAHPALLDALNYNLSKYIDFFLKFDPITKKSAFFYGGPESLLRPEVIRYVKKLIEVYKPPPKTNVLIIFPDLEIRFENSTQFQEWTKKINQNPKRDLIHVCLFSPIFGIIPEELKDVYPLTQHVYPKIIDTQMGIHAKAIFQKYIEKNQFIYKEIYVFRPKFFYNALNQREELISHPIDEIIKDNDEKFVILDSIEHLKINME